MMAEPTVSVPATPELAAAASPMAAAAASANTSHPQPTSRHANRKRAGSVPHISRVRKVIDRFEKPKGASGSAIESRVAGVNPPPTREQARQTSRARLTTPSPRRHVSPMQAERSTAGGPPATSVPQMPRDGAGGQPATSAPLVASSQRAGRVDTGAGVAEVIDTTIEYSFEGLTPQRRPAEDAGSVASSASLQRRRIA